MLPIAKVTAALVMMTMSPLAAAVESAAPVAIVCRLEGDAQLCRRADGPAETLRLYDRIAPGASITTGPGSEVELIFFDGERFLLEAGSRSSIGPRRAVAESGSVRRLESVPAVMALAPLVGIGPEDRAGAIRIRHGQTTPELEPSVDSAVLAEQATLVFQPLDGISTYRVTVEDDAGKPLYEVGSSGRPVPLPPGILRPGRRYYWRVEGGEPENPSACRSALFRTVSEEGTRAHTELERAAGSGDVAMALLLAEVDYRLGLRSEACRSLERTADLLAANRAIERALADFGCSH